MELKKLVVNVKEVWVDFPGLLGFKIKAVSYTHQRAHETTLQLVCRLLVEKK
mgnify:CR=1 FL=1